TQGSFGTAVRFCIGKQFNIGLQFLNKENLLLYFCFYTLNLSTACFSDNHEDCRNAKDSCTNYKRTPNRQCRHGCKHSKSNNLSNQIYDTDIDYRQTQKFTL